MFSHAMVEYVLLPTPIIFLQIESTVHFLLLSSLVILLPDAELTVFLL